MATAVLTAPFGRAHRTHSLFRGIVPPIGGIDISPIGAFFVLNLLTSSVASLGATGTPVSVERPPAPGSRLVKAIRGRLAHA